MKKLLFVAAICCSLSAMAQTDTTMKKDKMHNKMMMKDCVMMKDGKMMSMMKGQTMDMSKDMTMTDGSMVSTTGMVKKADGTSVQLMDGDSVYMDGKIKHKKKNM